MAKTYMTKETAIKYAKALFSRSTGIRVARDDALLGAGHAVNDAKWLSYILTAMGEYKLLSKDFDKSGKITHLVLTPAGREALGRTSTNSSILDYKVKPAKNDDRFSRVLTPESVNADVKELARLNPSFEVRLVFHPKDQPTD